MRTRVSKSLVDRAHDELLRKITDGELPESQRMIINRLARELGTSLIPVREALARLHSEGLVTFEYNKGYRVTPAPTLEELHRLFEARLIIETGSAELAAERCDVRAIKRLREINKQIAQGSYGKTYRNFRRFVELNERFHVELVALADNPALSKAYDRLGYHQQITRPSQGRGVGDVKRISREHDAILDALEKRDVEALRKAIRLHITNGFELYRRHVEREKEAAREAVDAIAEFALPSVTEESSA